MAFNRTLYPHPASGAEDPYSAKPSNGTAIGNRIIETFRWQRTGFIGAEKPGKLMLAPPSLPRYRDSSRNV